MRGYQNCAEASEFWVGIVFIYDVPYISASERATPVPTYLLNTSPCALLSLQPLCELRSLCALY